MADEGFSVRVDDDLAEDVRAAAAAKGVPVEMFVRDALASHVFAEIEWSDDPDPRIDDRIAEEAIRRGDTIPWETVRVRLTKPVEHPETLDQVHIAEDPGGEWDEGWTESFARYAEHQRTGEYVDAGEAMAALRKSVLQRIRARKA
jgi:predicted transcriptional regulator